MAKQDFNKIYDLYSFDAVIPSWLLLDKKIPNRAKLLYAHIRALSKKNGYCFATNEFLSEIIGVSIRTIKTYLRKLEKIGVIETEIKPRKGGGWERKIRLNQGVNFSPQQEEMFQNTSSQGEAYRTSPQGEAVTNNDFPIYKNINKKYNNISKESDSKESQNLKDFNFYEKLEKLSSSNRRDLQIIALYWKYKDYKFRNEKQYQAALKRELRPARMLEGYTDEEITQTMDWLCENTDIKWTLETVHKFIDEPLDDIEPIKGRKNGG